MNRPRREDESFEEYKENLKEENRQLKLRLEGRIIWDSSSYGVYNKRSK